MIQTIFLFIAAFGLASSAAYFSVFGLAATFSASFNSMLIIATFIELAKVVSISFLYRNWKNIPRIQKTLNILLVIITMLVTSIGVAGHLLSAYQTQTVNSFSNTTLLDAYQNELDRLLARQQQMDEQIAAFRPEFVTGRQRLIESFASERAFIDQRVQFLSLEIPKMQVDGIQSQSKIGPIIFIAELFGYDRDIAIFLLVALLVLIIDPLAIVMMMNANLSLSMNIKKNAGDTETKIGNIEKLLLS